MSSLSVVARIRDQHHYLTFASGVVIRFRRLGGTLKDKIIAAGVGARAAHRAREALAAGQELPEEDGPSADLEEHLRISAQIVCECVTGLGFIDKPEDEIATGYLRGRAPEGVEIEEVTLVMPGEGDPSVSDLLSISEISTAVSRMVDPSAGRALRDPDPTAA